MSGRISAALAAVALSALILAACSSDDSSPTGPGPDPDPAPPGTVSVVLRTGMWPAPSGAGLVPDMPPVLQVDFSVTTADSIYRDTHYLAGAEDFAEVTMVLPAGAMSRISCWAPDPGGVILHRSVTYRVLPSFDDTLVVNLADATDQTPPVMDGAVTATALGAREFVLEWEPATDGGEPDPDAAYLVWAEETAVVAKADDLPLVAVPAGQTSVVVGDLLPGGHYDITVAAVDRAGNMGVLSAVTGVFLLAPNQCYWVNGTTGVDAPDRGTFENPCRTITYALALSSGEPVYVDAGTYSAATGETFPLVLKDGTRLAGDIHWPTGRPQVILEVGTANAAIEVPISGSVSGFAIENAAGGMNYGIDAFTGDVRVDHVRIEGLNASSGIRSGARAHISYCTVRGLTVGRGISFYGDDPQTAWSCLVEDCASGITINGRDAFVHLCLVRDCNMGITIWGEQVGDTGDIQVSRTFVRDCTNGFDIQRVDDVLLLSDTVWRCTQMGIHLAFADDTVNVASCHIDGSPTGVYARWGEPVISQSSLVCNRVNLYVEGDGQVVATGNRWDHASPVVYELDDEYDVCDDCDICYDGSYSLTPPPLYDPTLGRTGCLSIGVMPRAPKALPEFLERLAATTGAGRVTISR